jgi:hypothetical protein
MGPVLVVKREADRKAAAAALLELGVQPGDTIHVVVVHEYYGPTSWHQVVKCLIAQGREVRDVSEIVARIIDLPYDDSRAALILSGRDEESIWMTIARLGWRAFKDMTALRYDVL